MENNKIGECEITITLQWREREREREGRGGLVVTSLVVGEDGLLGLRMLDYCCNGTARIKVLPPPPSSSSPPLLSSACCQ